VLSALAPLGAGTADALGALGVVIRQCYGTAEACGLLTVEPADGVRPASVGLPVAATELRVDDRGELLARGPQIARETLDGEGWLHTGDRARVDEASRVHLEGRVEDLIVTASGVEVDATAVARAFVGGRLVHRVVVTGDGRTGVGALLELEPNALGTWMAEQTPTSQDPLGQSQLHEELEREVATANDELPPDTQVQRFLVLPGPLEVDAELTGTRRLRRAVAIRSHADLVDELYGP
jgi:long-chain acyl-CoA synthetase